MRIQKCGMRRTKVALQQSGGGFGSGSDEMRGKENIFRGKIL